MLRLLDQGARLSAITLMALAWAYDLFIQDILSLLPLVGGLIFEYSDEILDTAAVGFTAALLSLLPRRPGDGAAITLIVVAWAWDLFGQGLFGGLLGGGFLIEISDEVLDTAALFIAAQRLLGPRHARES